LAACLLALAATAAAAQTGGIRVVVTDNEGNPLPGTVVTISHELGKVKTTASRTDKDGVVEFPVLMAGSGYVLSASFPGLAQQRIPDVRVQISQVTPVKIRLFPEAELQETVKVTAERDVIDIEKNEQSTRFSADFIQDLPVPGRFYQNVLTLAPGVQDADGDGNPNVLGSRDRDFQAIVGGVSNVDPLTGQVMSRVNPSSIEEMEVITAGAGVAFGRAQGGFANIVQKQGNNTHEGVFEFYWQTSKLDGDAAGGNLSDFPDPKFDTVQPLVQFSGPVLRDKLWYRVSYEQRNRDEPFNTLRGLANYTTDTENRDVQLTWQVSPRNKLTFQYRSDPETESNVGIGALSTVDSAIALDRNVGFYTVRWDAPYSPKVLVQSTAAWQDVNTREGPGRTGIANSCLTGADNTLITTPYCVNLVSGIRSGSWFRSYSDHRQRLTVDGSATVFGGKFWGMTHQFRLGIAIANERYFRTLTWGPSMAYFIQTVFGEDPDNPGQDTNPQQFGDVFVTLAVPQTDDVKATGTNWAVFMEDQFKPAQNLTLTVGARIDREEINSEGRQPFDPAAELAAFDAYLAAGGTNNEWRQFFTGYEAVDAFTSELTGILCAGVAVDQIGNCNTLVSQAIDKSATLEITNQRGAENISVANTNFSPFLSMAWSPWSNGKTVFRASGRRYYNNIPLTIPLEELEPALTTIEYRVDLKSGTSALEGNIAPVPTITAVDRNLKTPYQDEFSIAMERLLWAETSLNVRYVSRKYRDQLQDFNFNLGTGDYGRCHLASGFDPRTLEPSPGISDPDDQSTWLTDILTGELYMDTDPGGGDGRLDDCAGDRIVAPEPLEDPCAGDPLCKNVPFLERPDKVTDLYVQNPAWGDIFLVGNFNRIDSTSYIVELVRRQYRSWEMNASYTWSKAKGDGEDYEDTNGDDPSLRADAYGYQAYDQRHVVKFNATTITPWGVRLGTTSTWQSGLPYSLLTQKAALDVLGLDPVAQANGQPAVGVANPGIHVRQAYTTGQRNDQRNDSYWTVDLKATKELRLGKRFNMQLSAEIYNLLDDRTYQIYNPFQERGQQVNGVNDARYRIGRQWQMGMRLTF